MQLIGPQRGAGTGIEAASHRQGGLARGTRRRSPEGQPAPILLVEDDLDARLLVESALDEAGFRGDLHVVTDGRQVVEMVRDGDLVDRLGLVLLDIGLPGADGFQVLEAIRARAGRGQLPVVILTNRDEDATIRRGYALGANCWIRKPARYRDLERVLERVLSFWSSSLSGDRSP